MIKRLLLTLAFVVMAQPVLADSATVYKRNAHQLISSSTWTKLTFDTAEHDDNSFFDNTNDRLVVPAGCTKAQITAQVWYGGNSTTARALRIDKNGTKTYVGAANLDFVSSGTATTSAMLTSPVLSVSEGDYFEAYTWTGTTKWVWAYAADSDIGNTWFGINCVN